MQDVWSLNPVYAHPSLIRMKMKDLVKLNRYRTRIIRLVVSNANFDLGTPRPYNSRAFQMLKTATRLTSKGLSFSGALVLPSINPK